MNRMFLGVRELWPHEGSWLCPPCDASIPELIPLPFGRETENWTLGLSFSKSG